MTENAKKIYWNALTSSGGSLSLSLNFKGVFKKHEKNSALAGAIEQCYKFMEKRGYIPYDSQLLSSRDVSRKYGKTRQYWEKLLNEGKILYKETSAGRITTDLWVSGYLGNKEKVNGYVKNVKEVLQLIEKSGERDGYVGCPVCDKGRFEYFVNTNGNTNGICRSCSFHVHTTKK